MVANVGSLNVRVGADISGLTEGMEKAQRAVQRGADSMSKSAKASAQVFTEAKRSADTLLGSVDPLYAAQVRYDRELERAQALMKAGALTTAEMAKVQAGLKLQFDQSTRGVQDFHKAGGMARIGQMELGHAARSTAEMIALGQSPMRAIALEMGRVTQGIGFLAGGTSKFATFMGGPWGIAITAATLVLAPLLTKLMESHDAVGDLVEKMREQVKQAGLNKEAEDRWAASIDGLIDRNEKLTDDLKKRLKAEEDLERQQEGATQRDRDAAEREALAALQALNDLKARRDQLKNSSGSASGVAGRLGSSGIGPDLAEIDRQVAAAQERLKKANDAVAATQASSTEATIARGEAQAKALTDNSAAVDLWAKDYIEALHAVEQAAPASTVKITAAFDVVKAALGDAAAAGVPFKDVSNSAIDLARDLLHGKKNVDEYAEAMKRLAAQLEAVVAAAKAAKKIDPVAQFKSSVIGAEGTGKNRLGSLASGFGQFMPGTWLSYFNRLFPDKSQLSDAAKLSFRDVRSVAEAVIDKATDDYKAVLTKAGAQITAANLYAVHLLGAGDARKLLSAAPGAQTSSFLSAGVLSGNPFLRGTAASARSAIAGRIGDSSGKVSSGAAAIQAVEDQIVEKARAAGEEFQRRSDALDQQILAAQGQLFSDYQARASTLTAQVDAEKKTLDDAIDTKAAADKAAGISAEVVDAQAKILHEKVDQLTNERKAAIGLKAYVQLLDGLKQNFDQQKGFALDDLRFADSMATTQADHRKVQLEMLDIQYQQKEYDLKILLAKQQLAGAVDDAARTQAEINRLPTDRAHDQATVVAQTRSPLEQWAAEVPRTAAEINEALQSIEVRGIDGLAEAIGGVIDGTKSLKSAFHDLAASILQDLIQMTIKMLIFKALSAAFGIGSSSSETFSTGTLGTGSNPGFATGGSFTVLGNKGIDKNVLSLNGLPIANVSHGERLNIGNDNEMGSGGRAVFQHFDLRGAVMTDDLLRQMDEKSQQAAEAGARMGVDRMVDLKQRTFGRKF